MYIRDNYKVARGCFKMIGLEIYPLNSDEYAYLHSCGVDYVTILQEAHNPGKYKTLHPSDHKRCFPYRLDAQERALKGGMKDVGPGALLGLSNFRKDAFATGCHAWLLQRKYPHGGIVFSYPRLGPAINNDKINPINVHKTQPLQVITAYRFLMSWVSIIVSIRECARVRDHLASIAATEVSAGVGTGIGGHSEEIKREGDSQPEIPDSRSMNQVFRDLLSRNLQPMMNDYTYV